MAISIEVLQAKGWVSHPVYTHIFCNKKGELYSYNRQMQLLPCQENVYHSVHVVHEGTNYKLKAHRLIYECFNGIIEEGLQIDHINGIKNDNRLENLQGLSCIDHHNKTRETMQEFDSPQCKPVFRLKFVDGIEEERVLYKSITEAALHNGCYYQKISSTIQDKSLLNGYKYIYQNLSVNDDDIWVCPMNEKYRNVLVNIDGLIKFVKTNRTTSGSLHHSGYKSTTDTNRKFVYVHSIICTAFHGEPPTEKHTVDHINNIKDDNRAVNLRWALPNEQATNRSNVRSVEAYISTTDQVLGKWASQTEASKVFGINPIGISEACRGKRVFSGKTKDGDKISWRFVTTS